MENSLDISNTPTTITIKNPIALGIMLREINKGNTEKLGVTHELVVETFQGGYREAKFFFKAVMGIDFLYMGGRAYYFRYPKKQEAPIPIDPMCGFLNSGKIINLNNTDNG